MVFNDTAATQNGLIQDCEFWTGLGKAQISGVAQSLAEITRLINGRYDYYTTLLLNIQDEWDFDDPSNTGYPILTRSTVASQQDYAFGTALWSILGKEGEASTGTQTADVLRIKRVEISYDGTNWYKAEPLDINEIGENTTTTNIAASFTQAEPYYDIQQRSIFFYPIPDEVVTNGIKIWIDRNVDAFVTTDTTQQPAFDRAFHALLSMGASLDWMIAKGKDSRGDLSARLQQLEQRFTEFYSTKQKDRQLIIKSAYVDYE